MNNSDSKLTRINRIVLSSLHAETILQAILVGLLTGLVVVLFKISISGLFSFIQNSISNFDFTHKLLIFPLITTICTRNKRKWNSFCKNGNGKNGKHHEGKKCYR